VHDLSALLEKFKTPRRPQRTLTFLLYDHLGGVDTMLYTLSSAGCLITVPDRSPDTVLAAIERHKAELLPTSPTFLNLILISRSWARYDLSSLRRISYGTEPMPESTLRQFHQRFPQVALQQSYGLSEVGVLRSKSRASDSLWMKIGGEGYETRIVDGLLEIKADSVMLGYLNAPSPFTEDGWFITGDAVETDGDYLRILGRTSEMINVGGEKVFPAEVESVLLQIPGVKDATVYGEAHPITGAIVAARFNLHEPEPLPSFRRRMREYCRERLAPFKVPAKIELVDAEQFSSRFKKMRRP
jgi:acyl-CoA synthetase (AMP-forming)/AMP-acid ligase II